MGPDQALDQAVSLGELESNPSSSCKLPKVRRKEITPLEDSQIKTFLELIKGHPHEYLYKITLFTGMREGEVLGLTWACVDMQYGNLTVKQQLRREQKKGGQYYFSPTKNGKSRTIALSPSVVYLFRCQKQKQMLMKAAVPEWEKTNLVFTNSKGGVLSYRTVYDCFKRIVKKMGCPELRFHDLRHQYAVIAIKNGDDIKTIQGNLGHATAAFTLDVYGHVTEQMKRDSANRMESYLQALSDL
ncbi:MAG: site-specific integrase [Oscillospiraceae bacterium]|nr:site-specific integrase [Oscillospiraceae bacterium]